MSTAPVPTWGSRGVRAESSCPLFLKRELGALGLVRSVGETALPMIMEVKQVRESSYAMSGIFSTAEGTKRSCPLSRV